LQAELARAHERLGLITSILESRPKALAHYQKMRAIFERLRDLYPDNAAYQRGLAEAYFREGESYRAAPRSNTLGEAAFRHARTLQEALVRAHPEEPVYQTDLVRTLRSLGNLYLFVWNTHEQAEQTFFAARDICDHLPSTTLQQPAVRFEQAMVLLSLAKLYAHTDRPQAHESAARASILVFQPLCREQTSNPDYRFCFNDALTELGESQRRLGQPELARATLESGMKSAEQLAHEHPTNGYYRHLVADIAYSLASLDYHDRHKPEEARLSLLQAIDIELDLVIASPSVSEYTFYLGNLARDLRDWFGDSGRLAACRDRFTREIQDYEASVSSEKRDPARLLAYYATRAHFHRLLAQYDESIRDYKQAYGTAQEIGIETSTGIMLADRGEYGQAELTVLELIRTDTGNGGCFYWAARVNAHLFRKVQSDPSITAAKKQEQGERYAKHAVEWLHKARALKYFSAPSTRYLLADDRDLDPLRTRADFQALLVKPNGATERGK
jgi:hypothetical protein